MKKRRPGDHRPKKSPKQSHRPKNNRLAGVKRRSRKTPVRRKFDIAPVRALQSRLTPGIPEQASTESIPPAAPQLDAPRKSGSLKKILKWAYIVVSSLALVLVASFLAYMFFSDEGPGLSEQPVERIQTGQFHTGIYLPAYGKSSPSAYYILRDSLYQVEINAPANQVRKFRIEWLSEKEYELTFISSNNEREIFKSGDKVNVLIFSGGDNFYRANVRQRLGHSTVTVYKVVSSDFYARPGAAKSSPGKNRSL